MLRLSFDQIFLLLECRLSTHVWGDLRKEFVKLFPQMYMALLYLIISYMPSPIEVNIKTVSDLNKEHYRHLLELFWNDNTLCNSQLTSK